MKNYQQDQALSKERDAYTTPMKTTPKTTQSAKLITPPTVETQDSLWDNPNMPRQLSEDEPRREYSRQVMDTPENATKPSTRNTVECEDRFRDSPAIPEDNPRLECSRQVMHSPVTVYSETRSGNGHDTTHIRKCTHLMDIIIPPDFVEFPHKDSSDDMWDDSKWDGMSRVDEPLADRAELKRIFHARPLPSSPTTSWLSQIRYRYFTPSLPEKIPVRVWAKRYLPEFDGDGILLWDSEHECVAFYTCSWPLQQPSNWRLQYDIRMNGLDIKDVLQDEEVKLPSTLRKWLAVESLPAVYSYTLRQQSSLFRWDGKEMRLLMERRAVPESDIHHEKWPRAVMSAYQLKREGRRLNWGAILQERARFPELKGWAGSCTLHPLHKNGKRRCHFGNVTTFR